MALSASLDITYVVAELRGIQRPTDVRHVGGGKALNAVRAASRLGAPTRAVAVLGGGTGEAVRASAVSDGVEVEMVDGGEPTRVCVSVLSRDTGELTEIYEHATPVGPDVLDRVLDRAEGAARARPGWWLVSGGMPASLGDDVLLRVVAVLQGAGCRVAVDSHGPALRAALAGSSPDLVKVNRAEAAELVDHPVDTPLPDLLRLVATRTRGLVVVTDGAAGAIAAGPTDGTEHGPGVRAWFDGPAGRFPVGSGDAFLGGMLVALDGGADLAGAMRTATAVAVANAQVAGAAVFDPTAVGPMTDLVRVTSLPEAVGR
ncbi:PfkB family carbohydrate kinase [Cellulomonas sp. ATA003]|uniref:1-phosphofructokinase family hexose kinase n=1 Tax=Cellulomonas sp. ATA003 TaxID=3073064 RepID=UPI0028730B3F|nr:PfkB family carbohydrate kinase [Cellulomonas sp. ATA003]WNB85492.1 PfkB family carbohydrate kinase [Cellulomonas sp. ATA003]